MNLETLCSVLIEDPLSKIQKPPENTVSIVIDALDECELSARDEFVKVLLSKVRNMPSWVKFIVTTRSTKLLLEELPHVTVSNIEATERSNTEDIELFLVDQLQLLYSSSSKDQVQETARKIAARSSGIFLYAHFVFQTAKNRRLLLHELSEIFPHGIASVYEEYIVRSRAELKVEEEKFIRFLEAVFAADAPLSRITGSPDSWHKSNITAGEERSTSSTEIPCPTFVRLKKNTFPFFTSPLLNGLLKVRMETRATISVLQSKMAIASLQNIVWNFSEL